MIDCYAVAWPRLALPRLALLCLPWFPTSFLAFFWGFSGFHPIFPPNTRQIPSNRRVGLTRSFRAEETTDSALRYFFRGGVVEQEIVLREEVSMLGRRNQLPDMTASSNHPTSYSSNPVLDVSFPGYRIGSRWRWSGNPYRGKARESGKKRTISSLWNRRGERESKRERTFFS